MPEQHHSAVRTLVVGGGLLGGAVLRELARRNRPAMHARVNWERGTVADLERELAAFSAAGEGDWRVAWCAGVGVTATSAATFDREVALFDGFAAVIARLCQDSRLDARRGAVFLASSAGALYAGVRHPPYTEDSDTAPLSPYGFSKLALESRLDALAESSGVKVVAGRLTNLYGPGQNLAKPQGLISHLCRAHVTGQPISIYVPLDTLRDYLFVDDAAALTLDLLESVVNQPGLSSVKILASQCSVSVAAVVMQAQRVFRRPIRVLFGASSQAARQAGDLRVRSVVRPELDRRLLRTLPSGISATAADIATRLVLAPATREAALAVRT